MDTERYRGEIYNFYELLTKNNIEIPIIQRDYAQGRKDMKKIRLNFLNAIFNSINNEEKIMLDFIYGSKVHDSFQPLDGQQRLTTLYVLHWYAASKENRLEEEKHILSKFTYETRISSRDFCNALISNDIVFSQDVSPRSKIIDSSWFFLSWKNDPTIDAMLRTIDDIHTLFYEVEDLWDKLVSVSKQLIRFYHVELEHIGLTDDLYIKMNARGKLLTPYENFKASFEKFIRDHKWEDESNMINSFAFKIDGSWTDLFWKNFKKNNSIDNAFIRFISTIAMIRQSTDRIKKSDERTRIISKLQDDPNNISPKMFEKDDFVYLMKSLDLLLHDFHKIESMRFGFPLFRHAPKENIIKEVLINEDSGSYTQKVLLYAQLEYFNRTENINNNNYSEWMRVVRNIVSRADIEKSGKRPDIVRSPQTFDGVVYLINELAQGCENIYEYLANTESFRSTFAKDQVEEERIKAKLILDNIERKEIIHQLEDTNLLRGKIEFIFYCINFKGDVSSFNDELFNELTTVFIENLSTEAHLTNDLRRALLTISVNNNFEFYNYWWSFWSVVDSDKRRLIEKYREIEFLIHSEFKEYFKKLIFKLRSENLVEISSNFNPPVDFPNWKTRLIKEKNLLDNSDVSNYIAIPKDSTCCYLLKSPRPRDINGCIKIE